MGGKQLGFSDYEQATAKKRPKEEKFLAEMDQVVPYGNPCLILSSLFIQKSAVKVALRLLCLARSCLLVIR
jgi:hypothetical protein